MLGVSKILIYKLIKKTTTTQSFLTFPFRVVHSKSNQLSIKLLNKKFDKMIRVKLNETEQKVNISLKCLINADTEREFNLNRPLDEPISATFQKLYSNFVKQVKSKDSKSNKKLKVKIKTSFLFLF